MAMAGNRAAVQGYRPDVKVLISLLFLSKETFINPYTMNGKPRIYIDITKMFKINPKPLKSKDK